MAEVEEVEEVDEVDTELLFLLIGILKRHFTSYITNYSNYILIIDNRAIRN
jgi:hypothetical protein